MKLLREHTAARVCAMVLCVLCGTAAFWSGLTLMSNWDDLWSAGNFYGSGSIRLPCSLRQSDVYDAVRLKMTAGWGRELNYLEKTQLAALEERLAAENTNFRFQIRNMDGGLLWNNLESGTMDATAARETSEFSIHYGSEYYDQDKEFWAEDGEGEYRALRVATQEGTVVIDPRKDPVPAGFNQYGYSYDADFDNWAYDESYDTRIHRAHLVMETGVVSPLTVDDEFMAAMEDYNDIQHWLMPVSLVFLGAMFATLLLEGLLCAAVGHRKGTEGIVLTLHDRIPYDVYLPLQFFAFCVLLTAGDPIAYSARRYGLNVQISVGLEILALLGVGLALAVLLTTAVRLKSRTLLRNTLCFRLCARIAGWCRETAAHWPVTRRAVCLFVLYLLGTVVTTLTIILIPVYQGFVLWALCRWVRQWRAVRTATAAIVGGDPEVKIVTDKMYRDLREHAEQLNDLGAAINNAVDERLRSERFKTELITNVSHDLKTPLTSIINYVDLLKKTEIEDPKVLEYIDVLDRKSQRLKKLTEDLVEASKASTGTLPVALDRLDFAQLLSQAMGEYEEKFQRAGLTPVLEPGEGDCAILGDGRHLWRVIDNLLGNCCKYAMPGTRVYLSLTRWDGKVFLTVKNISREPLNVPPEQLMERFVRGEDSRTTEGSGLGLSIARSLTELQGGTFRLDIDGDLFKAVVAMPAAAGEVLSLK